MVEINTKKKINRRTNHQDFSSHNSTGITRSVIMTDASTSILNETKTSYACTYTNAAVRSSRRVSRMVVHIDDSPLLSRPRMYSKFRHARLLPNMYTMLVGGSGSGKDLALSVACPSSRTFLLSSCTPDALPLRTLLTFLQSRRMANRLLGIHGCSCHTELRWLSKWEMADEFVKLTTAYIPEQIIRSRELEVWNSYHP